jgi:hypothetical protein
LLAFVDIGGGEGGGKTFTEMIGGGGVCANVGEGTDSGVAGADGGGAGDAGGGGVARATGGVWVPWVACCCDGAGDAGDAGGCCVGAVDF